MRNPTIRLEILRAFAPCGLKSPPAEARHRGRVPQPSARRYDAADLDVGILSGESISSVVHFLSSCAFVLIQKHQKIKHGEKQRVTTPALTERAQKTPLLRRKGLRRFDCGGSAKSASGLCVRLLNVVLHTHSWRSPGAVTSSATFAVRSGRPETCHVRTQTNDYHCAQRTTVSALHRRRNQIGRRFERSERA